MSVAADKGWVERVEEPGEARHRGPPSAKMSGTPGPPLFGIVGKHEP